MKHSLDQDQVIEAFVEHLAVDLYPGLQVTDWPDKRPGASLEIDALAKSPESHVAIEHTSVDSFKNQRMDSARFMAAVGKLECELKGKIPFRIRLTVHTGIVPKGISWRKIRDTLRSWIINAVPNIPDGSGRYDIPGVPFPVDLQKNSRRRPGLSVGRYDPEDKTFTERVSGQLNEKAVKLGKYKETGWLTVLLVQSSDIGLMNPEKMRSAVEKAWSLELRAYVDLIWYADTSIPEELEFWDVTPSLATK